MHNDWKGTGISQDTTLSWYRDNAIQYAEETRNSLVLDALWEFLSRIKEGGTILDYGSGSGRDSAYFLDKGFSVDSLDGSAEMKAQAERLFVLLFPSCKPICGKYLGEPRRQTWSK